MQKIKMKLMWIMLSFLFFITTGCGKDEKRIEISELGFSMKLPLGWKIDKVGDKISKATFYKPGSQHSDVGKITQYFLEGKTLTEFVENKLEESQKIKTSLGDIKVFQIILVSKNSRTINGLEAIEVVYEIEDYSNFEVFIRKGEKVITVFIETLKEDFPKYIPSFRESIETIKIR